MKGGTLVETFSRLVVCFLPTEEGGRFLSGIQNPALFIYFFCIPPSVKHNSPLQYHLLWETNAEHMLE